MSISLLLHGYVVARGRPGVADDPNSKWNRATIDKIIRLGNTINSLSPELLQTGFNIGSLLRAPEISVLRNIWFERNKMARPQMRRMLDAMRAESGAILGTIVVETLDSLISHPDEQSRNEADLLKRILNSAVAIIDLNSASARRFLENAPADVTGDDVCNLIMDAADNRKVLWQKDRGVKSAQKVQQQEPLPVEEERRNRGPHYDLFSDPSYQPMANQPGSDHRHRVPDRPDAGVAPFVCPTCGTTVQKADGPNSPSLPATPPSDHTDNP